MNKNVSFNLRILPAEKTFLSAISSAALYGRGVFTSLAIYDSKPLFWEKHWRRLTENSAKLNIDLCAFDERSVSAALSQIVLKNNLDTGRARLTFFDEAPGKIWNFDSKNRTHLLMTTARFQEANDEFRLTVAPFPLNSKSPLAGVKSCNYLENLLALEDAKKRGFDEALRLNEKGEIASAATANIFWIKGEKILTPRLETGCLAGTTREFLLEKFLVAETTAELAELSTADGIFLTSAGIGIRPVSFGDVKHKNSSLIGELKRALDLEKGLR